MLNKIILILFKYIPAICVAGIFLNNCLYFFINEDSTILWRIPYLLDGISGISILQITLLFLISYKFQYCAWHRVLLLNCVINILLVCMDAFGLGSKNYVDIATILLIVCGVCCCFAALIHLSYMRQGVKLCISRHGTSSQFDKFLMAFIKWFPFIQLFFCLLSNLIATFDWDIRLCYILDFSGGNSYLFTLFIYCLSLRLGFPNYHRWFIIVNLINLSIAFCEANIYSIPATSAVQFYFYYCIAPCVCLIIIFANYIKSKYYEHKTQTT